MKRRHGMTLIEMLVAVGISLLLIVVLATIFRLSFRTYAATLRHGKIILSHQSAIERLTRQIGGATQVVASYNGYQSSTQTLIVRLPAYDNQGRILASTYDHIVYQGDYTNNPSQLREIVFPDPLSSRPTANRPILKDIDSNSFTYFLPDNAAATDRTQTKYLQIQLTTGNQTNTTYATLRNR